MSKQTNFKDVFIKNGEQLNFLLYLIMYPVFWWFWLFAENKSYTPNKMIKESYTRMMKNGK